MRSARIAQRGLALSFLTFVAQPARAQPVVVDSARLASLRAVVLSIPLGSPIRVRTVGQSMIEGRLAARSDTNIVLRHRRDSLRASMIRIAEISRPKANYKTGAIIGGLTGGVFGGLLAGTLASGLCDAADCHGAFAQGAVAGGALFGAIGVILGMGIGALSHHWEPFWP